MMYVDVARCTGCGACLDACPVGAIQLVEDERGRHVQIDAQMCQACEACVAACPEEAIMVQLEGELVSPEETMPAKAPSRAIQPAWPVPKAVVWAGTVLALAGREILPRVADLVVDAVARREPAVYADERCASTSPETRSFPKGRVSCLAPAPAAPAQGTRATLATRSFPNEWVPRKRMGT
jgi:ferredoxin